MSELSVRPTQPVVGVEMPHEAADLHVTGLALYTGDLFARYPGTLYAYPVQAPHAHATIRSLDTAPALAVPGVVYVLTASDVPGVNDAGVKHDEPLFPDEVCYFGHPVCWVLGETHEAARVGATKVAVDYDPLPSLITIKEAIAAESFQGARPTVRRGDPEAAFAELRARFSRASSSSPARSTSTWRPTPRWPASTRTARSSSSPRRSTRPRPRTSSRTCWAGRTTRSPCSACGWAAASAARRCSRTATRRSPRSAR